MPGIESFIRQSCINENFNEGLIQAVILKKELSMTVTLAILAPELGASDSITLWFANEELKVKRKDAMGGIERQDGNKALNSSGIVKP